jgi:hypothetical protein
MGRAESSRQAISDAYVDLVVRLGLPASCGRIFAALLLSPVPLTQAQLRSQLSLSEGSVSEGVRLLAERDFIERVGDPRARPAHFQVRSSVWAQSLHSTMANAQATYALAELVLGHLEAHDVDGPAFELMSRGRASYAVLVAELPAVFEKALAAGEQAPARCAKAEKDRRESHS